MASVERGLSAASDRGGNSRSLNQKPVRAALFVRPSLLQLIRESGCWGAGPRLSAVGFQLGDRRLLLSALYAPRVAEECPGLSGREPGLGAWSVGRTRV